MRSLEKLEKPEVLRDNEEAWLGEYLADRDSNAKRYRYRHPDIKQRLKEETGLKCVYCESKIGHNTPGDIEHKIPSSKDVSKHFDWNNLTISCTECNRRKNDYYREGEEFLDPYSDNVEQWLEHHGPLVYWKAGNVRAEISIRKLELNGEARAPLIFRKIEKLDALANVIERWSNEGNDTLKSLLLLQIREMSSVRSEYSAMILSVLKSKGITIA
ncbi:HNH endonuclease signature motif containing protein [Aromatoleum evansii]|uniref:HNH endonuclease signature motif containing protein n=1 Tax=Aromatoleum evansii TaxID=59406 RepID=A0ABZ1APA4_AROEV|nr:HNH endonuclease signature motif containing protein [Aromatoleum evansii]